MSTALSTSAVAILADFIESLTHPGALPPPVLEKARLCVFNAYGIGLACMRTPYAPVATQAVIHMYGEQADGATLLYDGHRTNMTGAMVANSALLHGRAQEDASGAAHFGAVLIPMLTAAAETGRMPLDRFLPALVAGYEVGGLLESQFATSTTPAGFRATTAYGTVAAAATASVALGLNAQHTAAALANAASFTGGVLQSFVDGTDEWRYQPGLVASNGWLAAELAAAGSVSAPQALEGKAGLVRALARRDTDTQTLVADIGKTWFIHRVVYKPHPVCAFNQTPVNAALLLRERLAGRAPDAIRVRMNPYEAGYAGMDNSGPFHSVSGTLMSIPFCIARTLAHGAPTLRDMQTYDDPATLALIAKTRLVADPTVEILSCIIEATVGGETLVQDLHVSAKDYDYDRTTLRALIVRVCAEVGVNAQACAALERFADDPAAVGLPAVLDTFAALRSAT